MSLVVDSARLADSQSLAGMAATIGHELKTPLNAIVGSISLLDRRLPEDSHDRVHVERLKRSSRHLIMMLDDMLELLQTGSGQFRVSPGLHRIDIAVDEALADVELHAAARGVAIVNAVPAVADGPRYWGDERLVRQIIVNLLTNAIKFTALGGRITIAGAFSATTTAALLGGPWTFIRVEDTGRGIPASWLTSVFEPFQQVEQVDRNGGKGLGLAISRQFARRMGGDITLVSEVGVGSSFTLWLPADAHCYRQGTADRT